jgi:predicted transcriptional regulator
MYNGAVRTTIEIKPEHRAKLLELAARRGEKGFSSVAGQAIEAYLKAEGRHEAVREKAQQLRGKLTRQEAERLRRRAAEVREFWR